MKNTFTLLIAALLISSVSFGQSKTFSLRGIVVDSTTKEVLPGASVSLNYNEVNTLTDAKGQFNFVATSDFITVQIKYVGYVTLRKTILRNNKPEQEVVFRLISLENQLEEVVISSKSSIDLKRPVLGVSSINIKTLNKLPTALGEVDILKGLQLTPGVSSVGEASNGVNVRGGTTDQNLFLVENAPIFNPTHMFGLFSAIPANAVSGFDLYKGNIPARYSGRTAAVIDVSFANPNLEKFTAEGAVSIVSNQLQLNMPIIKDKLAIVVSGRGAFNDWVLPLVSDKLKNIKANFVDGTSKIYFKPNNKHIFSLATYYSYDFFQTDKLGTIANINADKTQFQYNTFNNTLKWFYNINKKMNLQTTYVSAQYEPDNLLPEFESTNVVKISQKIHYQQIKTNLNYYLDKHTIEVGLDAVQNSINPGEIIPGTSNSVIAVKTQLEKGYELGASIEDLYEVSDKLKVSLGLRYSYFLNVGPGDVNNYLTDRPISRETVIDFTSYSNNEVIQTYGGFEPRIGISLQVSKNSNIKFGYNLARQYLQVISNTTTPLPTSRWKLSDGFIKPQISNLLSTGYFQNLSNNRYEFSTELYYRQTKNIIDFKPGADFFLRDNPETEILQGTNISYGIETMIAKKKGELTGWLNYTYARSLNQVNTGPDFSQQINGGDLYSANYDRPHTMNASIIIGQGKNHDFSFNFTYSTGRPFTTPVGFTVLNGSRFPFFVDRNNDRIPDYHRMDFSWNIYNPKLRTKRFRGNWSFSIYNLYGRKNPYSVFFSSEGGKIESKSLVIFGAPIPSLAYKFTFNK